MSFSLIPVWFWGRRKEKRGHFMPTIRELDPFHSVKWKP